MKRQRAVYPTHEIPHLWAHGVDRAIRNHGNLFTSSDGRTIYSYGEHFPIARRMRGRAGTVFVVNPRRYSVTTSGHQSSVRCAILGGSTEFTIPPGFEGAWGGQPNLWDALESRDSRPVVAYYQSELKSLAVDATAKRIRATTRARHFTRMQELVAEWRAVHAAFSLRCSIDRVSVPANVDLDYAREVVAEAAEMVKRQDAAQERRRKAQAEKRHAEALKSLKAWRKGERVYVYNLLAPALRISPDNPEEVETSMGARVPMEKARRVWEMLPRLRERANGVPIEAPDADLGTYRGVAVTKEVVIVGCHRIPWGEVEEFARTAGWAA